jgi:microcystin-dependent protein
MADPTTSNILLSIPTRGSDVGTWDLAVNGNSNALDGKFGGVTTIPVSASTTLLLTVPSTGSVSAGAGPSQSQNAVIVFTGALTGGNSVVQFTLPGFYIVNNQCVVGTAFIQLAPASGTGNRIGAPPGRMCHVVFDGINMNYVNMPEVGSFMDMAVSAVPTWISGCTVLPWLVNDGSVLNINNYTALGNLLGSTFGGNGVTTFGVPDLRARYRIPLDNQGSQGAAGRVTSAVSGINGTTIGAAGGSQALQAHTHGITDPGHSHTMAQFLAFTPTQNPQLTYASGGGGGAGFTANATTNISVATTGSGASGAIPPGLVFGMSFIKT